MLNPSSEKPSTYKEKYKTFEKKNEAGFQKRKTGCFRHTASGKQKHDSQESYEIIINQ